MRIGEVASRAGVHIETLRYDERRGLLPAPAREASGCRRYQDESVRRAPRRECPLLESIEGSA